MKKRYEQCILATACIPWDEQYNFDKITFKKEVTHLINNGITHIYLFGTAGEGYAVNNKQFEEIVSYFTSLMKDDHLYPMVGLIDLSLQRIEEKLDIAYSYGVRDFQFSLPSWHELSYDEIDQFIGLLCNNHKDCRFSNYNLGRVKRYIKPLELIQLAKNHKNFVAVKYTVLTDEDIEIFEQNETPLQLFLTENNFVRLAEKAPCSLLLSIGNLDLIKANEFYNAVLNKNELLISFYSDLFNEIRTILKSIIKGSYIDGAYDKLFVKFVMDEFPIRLQPPYKYTSDAMFRQFKEQTKKLL